MALAVRLAKAIEAEIVSADSRQVFRHMNIGTGKDLEEYGSVPYHLIDIRSPSEEFSVVDFRQLALRAIGDILSRDRFPILCGGTGHYLKALIENYRFDHAPTDRRYTGRLEKLSRGELCAILESHRLWDGRDWAGESKRRMARAIEKAQAAKRPESDADERYDCPTRLYHVRLERKRLTERIGQRLRERLRMGMVEEVSGLLERGVDRERLERFGLEYRWILRHLEGGLSRSEMEQKLFVEICRFAKRQTTFLRYLEKSGHRLIPVRSYEELRSDALRWIGEM